MANASNQQDLKERIAAVDFAINETVLYLDAYPKSRTALTYYHRLIAQREAYLKEYQRKYGPLTAFGNESASTWQWVDGPWPWEWDAN